METLFKITICIIVLLIFIYAVIPKYYIHKRKKKCNCGQEEEYCINYFYTTSEGGFGQKNFLRCPKNQKMIQDLNKTPFFKRVKKEIKEKGSSCPENWG